MNIINIDVDEQEAKVVYTFIPFILDILEKECMERDKGQPATELFIRINGMKMEVTKMVNESERMLQMADIDQFGSLSKYVRPYLGY